MTWSRLLPLLLRLLTILFRAVPRAVEGVEIAKSKESPGGEKVTLEEVWKSFLTALAPEWKAISKLIKKAAQ